MSFSWQPLDRIANGAAGVGASPLELLPLPILDCPLSSFTRADADSGMETMALIDAVLTVKAAAGRIAMGVELDRSWAGNTLVSAGLFPRGFNIACDDAWLATTAAPSITAIFPVSFFPLSFSARASYEVASGLCEVLVVVEVWCLFCPPVAHGLTLSLLALTPISLGGPSA